MSVSTSVPPTRREDVVDTYHGIAVADPYRWLEDGDDPEVAAWVGRPERADPRHCSTFPSAARWHERLVALMELPVVQHATLRGDRLFCYERPQGAEQFVLTRRSAIDPAADPVVLLDPADAERRRGDGDRLVLPVPRRHRRRSASARAGRSSRAAPRVRHRRDAGRRRRRPHPRHAGMLGRLGAGRLRVLLHPLSRPATSTTARSTTTASAPTGTTTRSCGTTGPIRRRGPT